MLGQRQGPRARRILRKDLLVTLAPTALIIVAAFGITMLFVKPAPPKKLTIAVAPDEGGSRYYARRYQEILKRHGITVPALYRWRVRSRVFRWYARLKQIELQLEEDPDPEVLDDMLKRLEDTERAVNQIPTPLAYAENLYFFSEHVDVVRRRIGRRLNGDLTAAVAAQAERTS